MEGFKTNSPTGTKELTYLCSGSDVCSVPSLALSQAEGGSCQRSNMSHRSLPCDSGFRTQCLNAPIASWFSGPSRSSISWPHSPIYFTLMWPFRLTHLSSPQAQFSRSTCSSSFYLCLSPPSWPNPMHLSLPNSSFTFFIKPSPSFVLHLPTYGFNE